MLTTVTCMHADPCFSAQHIESLANLIARVGRGRARSGAVDRTVLLCFLCKFAASTARLRLKKRLAFKDLPIPSLERVVASEEDAPSQCNPEASHLDPQEK